MYWYQPKLVNTQNHSVLYLNPFLIILQMGWGTGVGTQSPTQKIAQLNLLEKKRCFITVKALNYMVYEFRDSTMVLLL